MLWEVSEAVLVQPDIKEIGGDYTEVLQWRYSRTGEDCNLSAGIESAPGLRLNPLPIDKGIFESYQPPNFPRVTYAQT